MGTGGYRMGSPHTTVESCHSFSAWGQFHWALDGEDDDRFEGGWIIGDDSMTLTWRRDGRHWSQTVQLTWSPCHYGGRRAWLVCPTCHRRVGKLYLPTLIYHRGERVNHFACRHCFSLTYSQRQSRDRYWTLLWRAKRIADRWLIESKDENGFVKPKGMHFNTFHQKVEEYNALIERARTCAFRSMLTDIPVQIADVDSDAKARDSDPGEMAQMNKEMEEVMRAWLDQQATYQMNVAGAEFFRTADEGDISEIAK